MPHSPCLPTSHPARPLLFNRLKLCSSGETGQVLGPAAAAALGTSTLPGVPRLPGAWPLGGWGLGGNARRDIWVSAHECEHECKRVCVCVGGWGGEDSIL